MVQNSCPWQFTTSQSCLLVVRLILVPLIFLAVYYLFAMGWIVNRIVNVDAPTTTISEQVSVEMLEARRAERNYLLLRDPAYVEANRVSIAKARETLIEIQNLCRLSGKTLKKLCMNCICTSSALRRQFRSWEHQVKHPPTAFGRLCEAMKRI